MNIEIQEMYNRLEMAPNGKESMEICRMGWELADKEGSYEDQLYFRSVYMRQAAFYDDAMEMYMVYPVMLKKHDEYVKEHGEDPELFNILWKYKWILENAKAFYQITVEQFQKFEEDAGRRFMEAGYSLRAYHLHRSFFYAKIDVEKSGECYEQYLRCRRDRMSDCHACERNMEVQYLLSLGKEEEALERAQVLFRRQLTCLEIPAATYGVFLEHYNKKLLAGEMEVTEELFEMQKELRYNIRNRKLCSEYVGVLLMSYSLTNKSQALNWFKWYCDYTETVRNPEYKFNFALAAMHFFGGMKEKAVYRMNVSKSFPYYREDNTYSPAELYERYRTIAGEIATKMDRRNGNRYYAEILESI